MVRCIAIDDEPLALRQVKSYIERCEQLELVATCRSALEAQAAIELWNNEEIRKAFIKKIMEIDFSWKNSAERYLKMYAPLWKK